jgi:hypothetical protein
MPMINPFNNISSSNHPCQDLRQFLLYHLYFHAMPLTKKRPGKMQSPRHFLVLYNIRVKAGPDPSFIHFPLPGLREFISPRLSVVSQGFTIEEWDHE